MLSPTSSAVRVGRAHELDTLRETQRATLAGIPRGVVVAGEAGIGKSRLLHEFVAGLDEEVVVALGQCVALGSMPTPLQPIRGVLRDLDDHFGSEQLLAAAGPSGRLLAAVLPELAEWTGAITQQQLHDVVSLLLQRLSVTAPLAVVVEDLHWSDLPTLDLLRSLLRTLRHGRVLVAVSLRADEVTREHPLQPLLLDLERARDTTHIRLERLSEQETAEQVRRIRGSEPDPEDLAALMARSEGVPFFVEELLGLDDADSALPETLRELLLARYARLSEPTQAMVRLIAVGGVRVEHRVVEQVFPGEPDELDTAMREAIGEHVLRVEPAAYRFRHALTQEAVRAELLPSERRRLHAGYATALAADDHGEGRHAEIAHHWRAAGDRPRTLTALITALHEARTTGAPLVAAQLGELALTLWARVPDAAARAGCPRSRLFLEVARAYDAAADPRALPLLERAVDEVPEDDRTGRALLLHEAMIVRYGDGLPGGLELARRALEVLPKEADDEAQLVRARADRGRDRRGAGWRARRAGAAGGRRRLLAGAARRRHGGVDREPCAPRAVARAQRARPGARAGR